jgi:hypothetical protein
VQRIVPRIIWMALILPSLAVGSGPPPTEESALASCGDLRFDTAYTLHYPDGKTKRFAPGAVVAHEHRRAAFSPDGRYLAYLFGNERGGQDVHIYDIETEATYSVQNRFLWVKSLQWFEYRKGTYVLFDTPVRKSDYAYLKIFSVETSRVVLAKRGWSFTEFLPDRDGFRFELRQSRCSDAVPSLEEVAFDRLILYDAMWIPPEEARSIIETRLQEVVDALASREPARVAAFVHPAQGLLVSTEAYVDRDENAVFTAEQIRHAEEDPKWYRIGYADYRGDAIDMPLSKCLERYVMGDLREADEIGYNRVVHRGNTVVNTFESFPGSIVVEYYFRGNDENPGFTWHGTRLVFELYEGQWWLAAVTNDHWTI